MCPGRKVHSAPGGWAVPPSIHDVRLPWSSPGSHLLHPSACVAEHALGGPVRTCAAQGCRLHLAHGSRPAVGASAAGSCWRRGSVIRRAAAGTLGGSRPAAEYGRYGLVRRQCVEGDWAPRPVALRQRPAPWSSRVGILLNDLHQL